MKNERILNMKQTILLSIMIAAIVIPAFAYAHFSLYKTEPQTIPLSLRYINYRCAKCGMTQRLPNGTGPRTARCPVEGYHTWRVMR